MKGRRLVPPFLYHMTRERYVSSILEKGLQSRFPEEDTLGYTGVPSRYREIPIVWFDEVPYKKPTEGKAGSMSLIKVDTSLLDKRKLHHLRWVPGTWIYEERVPAEAIEEVSL